jgi:LysM repeat protein
MNASIRRTISTAGGVALLLVLMPPLVGTGTALAQCTARTQTGVGSNIVALAQRCGTTAGDLRRANPGRNLNNPGLLNVPGGRTGANYDSLNNSVAPRPPDIRGTNQRPVMMPTREQRRDVAQVGAAYSIRPGDTLSGLASRFDVPLRLIVAANPDVDPARLAVGQQVTIPQPAVD